MNKAEAAGGAAAEAVAEIAAGLAARTAAASPLDTGATTPSRMSATTVAATPAPLPPEAGCTAVTRSRPSASTEASTSAGSASTVPRRSHTARGCQAKSVTGAAWPRTAHRSRLSACATMRMAEAAPVATAQARYRDEQAACAPAVCTGVSEAVRGRVCARAITGRAVVATSITCGPSPGRRVSSGGAAPRGGVPASTGRSSANRVGDGEGAGAAGAAVAGGGVATARAAGCAGGGGDGVARALPPADVDATVAEAAGLGGGEVPAAAAARSLARLEPAGAAPPDRWAIVDCDWGRWPGRALGVLAAAHLLRLWRQRSRHTPGRSMQSAPRRCCCTSITQAPGPVGDARTPFCTLKIERLVAQGDRSHPRGRRQFEAVDCNDCVQRHLGLLFQAAAAAAI